AESQGKDEGAGGRIAGRTAGNPKKGLFEQGSDLSGEDEEESRGRPEVEDDVEGQRDLVVGDPEERLDDVEMRRRGDRQKLRQSLNDAQQQRDGQTHGPRNPTRRARDFLSGRSGFEPGRPARD